VLGLEVKLKIGCNFAICGKKKKSPDIDGNILG
jgi:hypothetical protein